MHVIFLAPKSTPSSSMKRSLTHPAAASPSRSITTPRQGLAQVKASDRLNAIQNITFSDKNGKKPGDARRHSYSELLMCGICSERANVPCANQSCGHICCRACWEQWFRVKEQCPMCRVPASAVTTVRIRITAN